MIRKYIEEFQQKFNNVVSRMEAGIEANRVNIAAVVGCVVFGFPCSSCHDIGLLLWSQSEPMEAAPQVEVPCDDADCFIDEELTGGKAGPVSLHKLSEDMRVMKFHMKRLQDQVLVWRWVAVFTTLMMAIVLALSYKLLMRLSR